MIQVTRLNGDELMVNADMIEFVEALPDTIITTTTGKKINVTESIDEVLNKIIEFRQKLYQPPSINDLGKTGG